MEIKDFWLSPHLTEYRKARFDYIIENLGFGDEILVVNHCGARKSYEVLTNTGVILIVGYNNKIITAYIANPSQVALIYHHSKQKFSNEAMITAKANYVLWKNSPDQVQIEQMRNYEKNRKTA